MKGITRHGPALLLGLLLLLLVGCGADDRAVQIAREAANRQAEQNQVIAKQNAEIATTAKHLVEADGQARRELVAVQHDLHTQEAEVAKQRDVMEAERRQMASQRLRESVLAPVLESFGVVLLASLALGYCCLLAYGMRHNDPDPEVSELLVRDLVSEQPLLMPPFPTQVVAAKRLPAPESGKRAISH